MREFVTKYGEEGIKSFLSLESGEEMGAAVLKIGEKLEQEPACLIYYKFNEIINQIKKDKNELEGLFKNRKNITDKEIEKIAQNLLSKGVKILIDFSDKIEGGEKIEEHDILEELKKYKTDLILTASVFGGIDKKDGVTFEDLRGVTFENVTSDQIVSNEEFKKDIVKLYKDNEFVDVSKKSFDRIVGSYSVSKQDLESAEHIFQMMEIYSKNYEDRPVFRKKLLEEFLEALVKNDESINFYMYKKDEEVVAFSRFDQMKDGEILATSLKVRGILCNSSIGKVFSDKCIEKEFRKGDIIASCDAFTPTASVHIEDGKFVANKIMKDYNKENEENSNVPAFIIKKERGKEYDSQNLSREDILNVFFRRS